MLKTFAACGAEPRPLPDRRQREMPSFLEPSYFDISNAVETDSPVVILSTCPEPEAFQSATTDMPDKATSELNNNQVEPSNPEPEPSHPEPVSQGACKQTNTTISDQDTLHQRFTRFDGDGDGHLTSAEMTKLMVSMGYDASEVYVAKVLEEFDADHSGNIEVLLAAAIPPLPWPPTAMPCHLDP